jgi:DNA-binding response OmpR family regulator
LFDRGLVFIVDDDASSVADLQALLEKDGYTVGRTAGGEDALDAIATARPNVVLLDVHLAYADPFELLDALKQSQHGRDIPLIFMTNLDDAEARVKGLESGDDLIVKPFDAREVLARIERQVTVSKVRAALRESEAKFRSVMESAIDAIISGNAARCGAAQLQTTFAEWQSVQLRMGEQRLDQTHLGTLVELDRIARARARKPTDLNALARSDEEVALEPWLEKRGTEDTWKVAPALVSLAYGESDLDGLAGIFNPQQLALVIEWLGCTYAIYSLVGEIGLSTGRIAEIVKALKNYAYMNQAPVQSVDVREGLDNTLIILHNKLKKGVTVLREYAEDLPLIQAYASELNQV